MVETNIIAIRAKLLGEYPELKMELMLTPDENYIKVWLPDQDDGYLKVTMNDAKTEPNSHWVQVDPEPISTDYMGLTSFIYCNLNP